jgi:RNA polymerase sigma-70 factor, ECF subfamily
MVAPSGDHDKAPDFERVVLPHLDAAYNLAHWLVRNPADAEDVVQEACLRAVKFFGGYRGGESRAWLLRIVRNTAYSFLEKKRPAELSDEFDELLHVPDSVQSSSAEDGLLRANEADLLRAALEALPVGLREALILRELEELSYKQIADVMEIPIGSVMSSLARGRERLRAELKRVRAKEVPRGLRR